MNPEDLMFHLIQKDGGKWHIDHSYAVCRQAPLHKPQSVKIGPYRLDLEQSLERGELVIRRLHDGTIVTDFDGEICVRCTLNFFSCIRAKLQLEEHKRKVAKRLNK